MSCSPSQSCVSTRSTVLYFWKYMYYTIYICIYNINTDRGAEARAGGGQLPGVSLHAGDTRLRLHPRRQAHTHTRARAHTHTHTHTHAHTCTHMHTHTCTHMHTHTHTRTHTHTHAHKHTHLHTLTESYITSFNKRTLCYHVFLLHMIRV